MSAAPEAKPRPAATIVLLRDSAQGPEVFMLRRALEQKFIAGAYVFPGGKLDDGDADPRMARRVVGLTEQQANARLGLAEGGLAYWIAAARECFEESGILIAVDAAGRTVDAARAKALGELRKPLHAGELGFAELLEREDLYVPARDIAWFAHWITPKTRVRRFDTRFFVAVAPHGQEGSHDQSETIDHAWVRPAEALERGKRGEIELVFATRTTLGDLSRFTAAADALAHAQGAEVELNAAVWALAVDGAKSLYRRSDAPYHEIHWSDPQETGETSVAIVPGTPKRLDARVTRVTAPNPGVMTGPGTNAYVVGEREVAIIDPGPDIESHREAILAVVAGRPVKAILCTHTHVDHSPGAVALAKATGAPVLGRPAPEHGNQDRTFAPARVLADGERVAIDGTTLVALHTPGHASNHLCYLLEETGMLFTGDHVMQGSTVVINPPDGDMQVYLQQLERIVALAPRIFAPGHGYLLGDTVKAVRKLIAHRHAREAKVVAALEALDGGTIESLLPKVYDDVSPRLHPVASRSLAAHLGKLVADGRASESGGRYRLETPSARG